MENTRVDTASAWTLPEVEQDPSWRFELAPSAAKQMAAAVQAVFDPARDLLDHEPAEFDLGSGLDVVRQAITSAQTGRGLALISGLPRDGLSAAEFRLLTWAIGLHLGVPRPQGARSHYVSEVRAAGQEYRSASGRGYNTNAALDFHMDDADLVLLSCYNGARSGGQSLVSSSTSAWNQLLAERPDLAEVATQNFHFSRNTEEAPDEAPFYQQPLFDRAEGLQFARWNRNRVRTAQAIEDVPPLSTQQRECADLLDEILRRPDHLLQMWLKPGDLQIMNNHVMLHSRTAFEDHADEDLRRCLYRVWIAPPNSPRLPLTWKPFYRSIEPGTVRGGIRGHEHNAHCQGFEARQAQRLQMSVAPPADPW